MEIQDKHIVKAALRYGINQNKASLLYSYGKVDTRVKRMDDYHEVRFTLRNGSPLRNFVDVSVSIDDVNRHYIQSIQIKCEKILCALGKTLQ